MKKLLLSILLLTSLTAFAQTKDTLVIELKYKSDTQAVRFVHVDSLNYVRTCDGLFIRSGYGSDRYKGYYRELPKEQYLKLSEGKVAELRREDILNIIKAN